MLTNSFSVLFYLKKRSNYVSGPLPIYLRISLDGERFELTTKRVCEPEKWNSTSGRRNGNREDARTLNTYLDELQSKLHEIHRHLVMIGKPVTISSIKAFFYETY